MGIEKLHPGLDLQQVIGQNYTPTTTPTQEHQWRMVARDAKKVSLPREHKMRKWW